MSEKLQKTVCMYTLGCAVVNIYEIASECNSTKALDAWQNT